ncbi:hypothetical protein [Halostagnicola bangensis]
MIGIEVAVAGCVLVATVGIGLVAHELSHALILRLGNVEYEISYFPARSGGVVGALASYPWAVVEPSDAPTVSTRVLRIAALSPLALTVPAIALTSSGISPADDPFVAAFTIGVLACALPSPQDFSVAFYAHRHEHKSSENHGSDSDIEPPYSRDPGHGQRSR